MGHSLTMAVCLVTAVWTKHNQEVILAEPQPPFDTNGPYKIKVESWNRYEAHATIKSAEAAKEEAATFHYSLARSHSRQMKRKVLDRPTGRPTEAKSDASHLWSPVEKEENVKITKKKLVPLLPSWMA